jgi:tetratricopeptide (TPR) repeat protein
MSQHLEINPGISLQKLLAEWKKTRQATGGWFALAGFSLQTSIYLLRFFQGIEKARKNEKTPADLAEMELLSDILCPADGNLLLIQVKRTLSAGTLTSALKEAYFITQLCLREAPNLLDRIRFQIACQKWEPGVSIQGQSLADVIKKDGDERIWNSMLGRFHPDQPIVEENDSLGTLWTYLWNLGIEDPFALVEQCTGRLLSNFNVKDTDAVRRIGWELNSYLAAAPRRDNWVSVGEVLTGDDIVPDPRASEYTEVLTGQVPRLKHLRKGFFRSRPEIFKQLAIAFNEWVSNVPEPEIDVNEKIPVFWISGRSGEGKSVLLLQLVGEILRLGTISPLLQLRSGIDLPRLMIDLPLQNDRMGEASQKIYAVIDDIYDLPNRDAWDEEVRDACALHTPPAAIITCGPTEQREQFESRLPDVFKVYHFPVPNLELHECREFLEWYTSRTGEDRDFSELTTDNPLLVQFVFELAQGITIPEFAQRFKKRLQKSNIFGVTKTILAANALYMDAPLSLVGEDIQRDALERLCEEDQLHFRITPGDGIDQIPGIRLAHAHLAWLFFIEWVEPPTSVAKAWARELGKVLSVLEKESIGIIAGELISRVFSSSRLLDHQDSSLSLRARNELLTELYRVHLLGNGGLPSIKTLPRWLELEYKIPELLLTPAPSDSAPAYISDPSSAPVVHGSVAAWLWLIAESKQSPESEKFIDIAKDFFTKYAYNSGVGASFVNLFGNAKDKSSVGQFSRIWVDENLANPQAYNPLALLVSSSRSNSEIIGHATQWLNNNKDHPKVHHVLACLVSGNPGHTTIRIWATQWLDENRDHPQVYQVLASLAKANPANPAITTLATQWLEENRDHPQAHLVLASLARANPANTAIATLATQWLDENRDHPQVYLVLASLVRANPADPAVRIWATQWLDENRGHPHAYLILASLARANPANPAITTLATEWLNDNKDHPQAYQLLASSVKANPANAVIRTLATLWLGNHEDHPQAYELLSSLVAANPADAAIRTAATEWLNDNKDYPQAYRLLASLVASNPADSTIETLATEWLNENKDHPPAYELLLPLVAANPDAPEIKELAIRFLKLYENRPGYSQILSVLITRTDGADEWMDLGEEYFNKQDSHNRAGILAVLMTGGKALPRFIEMALSYIKGPLPRSERKFILFTLTKIVHNLQNAVLFLYGPYSENDKNLVCKAIALGLDRSPDSAAEFALNIAADLNPEHLRRILIEIVRNGMTEDFLDAFIAEWLNENYHRTGYGAVLTAFARNLDLWNRVSLQALDNRVIYDFEQLNNAAD